jgi:hypothetical protein
VQTALLVLQRAGADGATLSRLASTQFVVGQLPGNTLSLSFVDVDRVVVEASADGWGWFVDPTGTGNPPANRILLTDVVHEMGHTLDLA